MSLKGLILTQLLINFGEILTVSLEVLLDKGDPELFTHMAYLLELTHHRTAVVLNYTLLLSRVLLL